MLIRTILVLLFAMFGTVAAFAAPEDWVRVNYPVEAQEFCAVAVKLTITARAPLTTSAHVMTTGTEFAQTGNLRALAVGDEQWASISFGTNLDAPNTARGADSVATYNPLRAELTAEEVAQGHAWTKHGYEFEDLGITQRYQDTNSRTMLKTS